MAVEERDPHTGHKTTGHEWNGIKELNTPVPKPIYFFLGLTTLVAIVYWILLPAWPLGGTHTKGLLGYDERQEIARKLETGRVERSVWTAEIEARDFSAIENDPVLMEVVGQTGKRLFGDNCSVCHGREGRGNQGFPNLRTTSWLWGGSPEQIDETIRVGINSSHPESRTSEMPAFGRDGILQREDIQKIAAYVANLSQPQHEETASSAEALELFAANCAACHGDNAEGNPDLGTPNLSDRFWIYGGDKNTLITTIFGGRQGHMPTWESRLSVAERKILALYVFGMREE